MTRQQEWSREALTRVLAVAKNAEQAPAYNTLCQKMPGLVQRSGLLQAVVFVQSRGDAAATLFADDIAQTYGLEGADDLRLEAQTNALPAYMALTRDMIEVAVWFRRFAQIELGETED